MCITEADIHGPNSRIKRRLNLTKSEIDEKLFIPGYSILLPDTWKHHDQARLLVFVSDDIKAVLVLNIQIIMTFPLYLLTLGWVEQEKYVLISIIVNGLME